MTEKFSIVREPDDDHPRRWVTADIDHAQLARNREAFRALIEREKENG